MASINRPDKLSVSSVNDPQLGVSNQYGYYSQINVPLQTPVLNAKGVQMISASVPTSALQLSDTNGELMFWYYATKQAGAAVGAFPALPLDTTGTTGKLGMVRFAPSNYSTGVNQATSPAWQLQLNRPFTGSTALADLVTALNLAAGAGGDDTSINPYFLSGAVTFAVFNGRIVCIPTATDGSIGTYISPLCPDDPLVLAALKTNTIILPNMNATTSTATVVNTTASTAIKQPYVLGYSMAAKLGYTLKYVNGLQRQIPSIYGYSGSSRYAFNNPVGVCYANSASSGGYLRSVPADSLPNLLGTTSINVYMDVAVGSGLDGSNGKNLIATIPCSSLVTNQDYTFNSVEKPALSLPEEIYSVRLSFTDQNGLPLNIPQSFVTNATFVFYY